MMSTGYTSYGSSPRGRGTRPGPHRGRARLRFIPARAGNTARPSRSPLPPPVHPRAGGEHARSVEGALNRAGSSPRGRGTPAEQALSESVYRFIPARAGNTSNRVRVAAAPSVHPRAGGEHSRACDCAWRVVGSSPRGRGTLLGLVAGEDGGRFIPARAGNTKYWCTIA